jgi:hypothetical protein
MKPSTRSLFATSLFAVLLSGIVPLSALHAATGDTLSSSSNSSVQTGMITVEQNVPTGTPSGWTLLSTDQHAVNGSQASQQVQVPYGNYTFFIDKPKGYSSEVRLMQGTTVLSTSEDPQLTFQFSGQDNLKISVTFHLMFIGKVSVQSTPLGIPFELRGPNGMLKTGVTQVNYDDMPIGLYSVRYMPQGCAESPPKSDELVKDGRVDFMIQIKCDTLEKSVDNNEDDVNFVSTSVSGQHVVFHDVSVKAWFATYVDGVARRGIISGYKNDDGTPRDQFGPENPVTLAELAKIALFLSGSVQKTSGRLPENPSAPAWAAPYVAAAEQKDWFIYTDSSIDLNRPATRAEVLETLLQALDIPLKWPKGNMFTDVTRRTPYASAVETAAGDGLVAGQTNADGTSKGTFNPDASINRAELAKIITLSIAKYRLNLSATGSTVSD